MPEVESCVNISEVNEDPSYRMSICRRRHGPPTFLEREMTRSLLSYTLVVKRPSGPPKNPLYWKYNGSIYEKKDGAAMGSPVSAVIANLYMESFEEQVITISSYEPRIWKRHVDDTFTILDRENVDDFLQHLNNQQPSIRFTMETEKDNKLAFQDTVVLREPDGRLTTSVYRKPTRTDQYSAYDSHHPKTVKRGIVKCL